MDFDRYSSKDSYQSGDAGLMGGIALVMGNETAELTYHGIETALPGRDRWDRGQQAVIRGAAHEIRSTLASVTISAEMLTAVPAPPPQRVRHHAGVIAQQAHQIGHLLDDLIAVVSDQLQDSATGVVDVNEVIWEAAQQLWQVAKQRLIKLAVLPSPEVVVVQGKRSYLTQAVRGCLENGLLNLPEGSQISISVKPRVAEDGTEAVEILLEHTSAAAEQELPRSTSAATWDQVTMLAVRRIVETHQGDVAPLGDGREGLRMLLPRHQAAGAKQMTWNSRADSPPLDESASAVA